MQVVEGDFRDIEYRLKVMVGIVLTEIMLLVLFNYWPQNKPNSDISTFQTAEHPVILDDVQITTQGGSPPAPPAPVIPVEVPNDKIIKEHLPEFNDIGEDNLTKLPRFNGNEGNGKAPIVGSPGRPPSVVKIVEPAVPEAAKRAHVKVEIVVNFLVDTDGAPEKVSIADIKLYDKKTGKFKDVNTIGYGIIDVTLKAAAQWRFRPAEQGGKKVRAYSKHIFTFGI